MPSKIAPSRHSQLPCCQTALIILGAVDFLDGLFSSVCHGSFRLLDVPSIDDFVALCDVVGWDSDTREDVG